MGSDFFFTKPNIISRELPVYIYISDDDLCRDYLLSIVNVSHEANNVASLFLCLLE